MLKNKTKFERDFSIAAEVFPKLKLSKNDKHKEWILKGELDICDNKGAYWDSYTINISVPFSYPYCVPKVWEDSNKIHRIADRHIDASGQCCLDIDHQLIYMAKKGIYIKDFIYTKIYSFFANQIYYDQKGHFAKDEYEHFFNGVIQFYTETLRITSPNLAILFLERIINGSTPRRNEPCLCNSSKKTKFCHQDSVDFLLLMDKKRLKEDLVEFQTHVNKSG